MENRWKQVKLEDILNFRRGHDLSKKNMSGDNYPVVGSNGIIGYHNEFIKKSPCVTIGRSGNIGTPYYYNQDCWPHNTTLYIDDFKGNDEKYIFYLLKKLDFKRYAGGSAVPTLNRNHIHPIDVFVTLDVNEQKAIAKILSDLDEKIETNNKINKKLEEMAQAIFKQWFVDFEFLNEDGKPYKSSGGEMVESELGMIPKGWKIGTFREFTDTVLGGDWGKETEQGNYKKEVLCLRGADIPEIKCGKIGASAKRFILEKNYNNKKLNGGDLVVEISGGSPTQSTGRITYINEGILNRYDLDFVCTNFCRAITLNNKKAMEYFYFYWSYLYDLNVFFQYENGTTGIKNFDVNTFLDKHKIIIPPNYLLEKYHLIISNILNTIQHNGLENSKLSNTRDILLPKLMSGEIRVPID